MTQYNRKSQLAQLVLFMMISLMVTLIATPAAAVDGGNPDKPLNYGLHWFRTDPSASAKIECGSEAGHDCIDAVLYDGTIRRWKENPAAQAPDSNLEPFYDPDRPTLIYFHGWQPNANGTRENLKWTYGSDVVDLLEPWAEAGWNVGIFYWNQFADTVPLAGSNFGVTSAQGKIWSSMGVGGLGYKYGSGYITANYYKKPNSSDLGLPMFSSKHLDRWDNQTDVSRAISALRFIQGVDPSASPDGVEQLRQHFENASSCEEAIRSLSCDVGSSPLCAGTRLDWRELFFSKVCQVPSVGDLAFENVNTALQDQVHTKVVFAGHSLGHQVATRTATHMWMAHVHGSSVGADPQLPSTAQNRSAMPKRLELLDPYATQTWAWILKPYTADGNIPGWWKPGITRAPTRRVYEYVKRLKEMTENNLSKPLPVSYHHSTILAEIGGASWNPKLAHESAYERHYFDYAGRLDYGFKHSAAKDWFLASMSEGAMFPQVTAAVPLPLQAGLAAGSWNDQVRQAMGTVNDVSFLQEGGRNTFDYKDDTFTPKYDHNDFEWPANFGPVNEHEVAVARRLFNNSLTITADGRIDKLFVNGEDLTSQVKNKGKWRRAGIVRNLDLHNGHNVIAVKATDGAGMASLIAVLDLNGGTHVSNGHWKVTHTTPGANWMEVDFDDSDWDLATVHRDFGDPPWRYGVSQIDDNSPAKWIWSDNAQEHNTVYFRYVMHEPGPWKVRLADTGVDVTSLATAQALMNNAIQADLADGVDNGSTVADVLNFSDSGNRGLYSGDQPFPNQPGNPNTFAFQAKGTIIVNSAGHYTFGFNVNDGARIRITKDGVATNVVSLDGVQPATTRLGRIYLEPGSYEIEILAYDNTNVGAFEAFVASGQHFSWNANDFELLRPYHDLDRVGQSLEETDVCYDLSAGITAGKTGRQVTDAASNMSVSSPEGFVTTFLAQMQTAYGPDTCTVRTLSLAQGAPTSTASVKIEEETTLNPETAHGPEVVGYVAVDGEFPDIRNSSNQVIGFSGSLQVHHEWKLVTVPHGFRNPVVIAYQRNNGGADPAHVRLKGINGGSSSTTFQVKIEEWHNNYDGIHAFSQVDYIVIEAGVHYMRGGQVIQAGKLDIRQTQAGVFTRVWFPMTFSAKPIVMSMSQTFNGADPIVTRQKVVKREKFDVLVEEEDQKTATQSADLHTTETIGWMAVAGNSLPITNLWCTSN